MQKAVFRASKLAKIGMFSSMIVGCAAGISLSYFTKQALLVRFYKGYIELHGNDGPIKPSERLMNLFSEVQEDVKNEVNKNTFIEPFIIPGLKTYHSGTVATFMGGVVGLPAFFEFNSMEDVDNKILVKNLDNHSVGNDVEELYDYFFLSDKAKKYAVAHEILLVNTLNVYVNTVLPPLLAFALTKATQFSAIYLNIPYLPLHVRGFFYTAMTIFGVTLWIFIRSTCSNYLEIQVGKKITQLGRDYVEGAVEYYDKAIKRDSFPVQLKDQNIRVLKIIHDVFSTITLFRHIPLSHKKAFYIAHLEADSNK